MRLYRYIIRDPKRFDEETSYLLNNPEFENDVIMIKKKWDISEKSDRDNLMDKLLWDDGFDLAITALMGKNTLGENWRDWLYRYVIYDDKSNSFDPNASIIMQDGDYFFIQVKLMTNLEEVQRALNVIKELQGTKGKRIRLKKNLERDSKILRLASEGKKINEIYRILLSEGIDIDFGNIKNIVSRAKNKTGYKNTNILRTQSVTDKLHLS